MRETERGRDGREGGGRRREEGGGRVFIPNRLNTGPFVLQGREQARDEEWRERKRETFERVKQKGRERIDSVY